MSNIQIGILCLKEIPQNSIITRENFGHFGRKILFAQQEDSIKDLYYKQDYSLKETHPFYLKDSVSIVPILEYWHLVCPLGKKEVKQVYERLIKNDHYLRNHPDLFGLMPYFDRYQRLSNPGVFDAELFYTLLSFMPYRVEPLEEEKIFSKTARVYN